MSLTVSSAKALFSSFEKKCVGVIGDAFVDTYVDGVIERLNPESRHVHLLRIQKDAMRLRSGGAGNVARNLLSLGAKAWLLSVCGKDALGEQFQHIARDEGYEAHFVVDPLRSTIEKRRYVTEDGVLLRADYEDDQSVKPICDTLVEPLLEKLGKIHASADAILVSDYNKGLLTKHLCNRLLDEILQKPVLADVKPEQAGYFVGVHMLTPNLSEASKMLGIQEPGNPEEMAPLLAKRLNTEVFLTAGSRGIYIASKSGALTIVPQQHKVKVSDESGCGDTAAATILLAKLSGATSIEAAELANAAAAVTVSMVGAYAPSPIEVLRMLGS